MSTFQEAIARAVRDAWWHMMGGDGPSPHEPENGDGQIAFEVLQTPEMKAIREWIAEVARDAVDEGWTARRVLGQLPPSVIDWVLGGDDERVP